MRNTVLSAFLMGSITLFAQTPANDPHWQLVWEDHFNVLDQNIWDVKNHHDHYGEPQVYTNRPANIFIDNGNLVLRVKNELYSCPTGALNLWGCYRQSLNSQPYYYTSAMVDSKQPYNTQFGYIEARIKMPHGMGFWPAFWTNIGWGATGNAAEIDIFEMLGYMPPTVMTTNLHTQYPDTIDLFEKESPTNFNYTDWHTYGVEWSADKIIWYVDGFPIRLLPNHGVVDPVRIILNFAISPWSLPNSSTPFPADMLIDFVKVYDLEPDCNTTITACNYNFGLHDNKVKREIIIGDGTCTNTLSPGQNVFLRASENIVINGDFSVPLGAEFYMDVNTCH